jgi:PKD repeat protein
MHLHTRCLITCCLLISGLASGQVCNYLAYDGFNYTANTALAGQQGGSGWQAPWTVQNGNQTIPGFQASAASPLTFGNLQTTGNYISGGYAYLTAGRRLNTAPDGPFAPYLNSNGAIGAPGSTLWMSILLRKTENNGETVAAYWHPNNIDWCSNCDAAKIAVGYFGTPSDVGTERRWSLSLNGTVYPTLIALTPGQTAFFVLRVDFGATNTVALYLNPTTLGNNIPASPTLLETTTTALNIRSFAFYPGNDANSGQADEMRMGASYACVAPDNSVVVNQAPIPDFTVSPGSGQAPLPVSLNAAASVDPDGTIASYTWNFGDGSAVETGVSVTHTFTATGVLQVTLTITDNNGASAVLTKPVTVLNPSGTFSCQTSLTVLQLATCGQADGSFKVNNANNVTLVLRDATGSPVPPKLNTPAQFDQLAPGHYTLYMSGSGGCRDTFPLTIATDSSSCPGWTPAPCSMTIGAGLEGFAYYSTTRTFKDYFKSAGTWITYDPAGVNQSWDTGDLAYLPADPNGYPTAVPFTTPNGQRAVRGIISANGFIPVGEPMRLLYDGTGTITMQGAVTIQATAPGHIDFTVTQPQNIWFHLSQSQAGDPVRNIRVVAVADLATYQTQPFRQHFLEKAASFQALRFMDWMQTNGNGNIQWANRTKPGYYSQAVSPNGGVAYEYVIQLANTLHKDIWVCIPHQADDDYIRQMALLFRDGLDAGIQVYLEFSNEVWNWQFSQATWVSDHGPQNLSYPRRYAERATHAFSIWTDAWGAGKGRLRRVLGTQAGYDWVTEEIMAEARATDYDYISPSWYVGLDHTSAGVPDLTALGASATAADVLANAHHVFLNNTPRWKVIYNLAKLYGKKVVNYEGGQHFTNFTTPAYIQAMYDAQVDPGMYTLYQGMLDTLRKFGSDMPFAFVLCGPWKSVYGSWGHLFDIDDPGPWTDRPKYQVLLDNMCAAPPLGAHQPASSRLAIRLFPNPAGKQITVTIGDAGNILAYKLRFLDMTGRVRMEKQIHSGETIEPDLPAGVYLTQIIDADGQITGVGKVIILR